MISWCYHSILSMVSELFSRENNSNYLQGFQDFLYSLNILMLHIKYDSKPLMWGSLSRTAHAMHRCSHFGTNVVKICTVYFILYHNRMWRFKGTWQEKQQEGIIYTISFCLGAYHVLAQGSVPLKPTGEGNCAFCDANTRPEQVRIMSKPAHNLNLSLTLASILALAPAHKQSQGESNMNLGPLCSHIVED